VRRSLARSVVTHLVCGVSQVSVLGPILFVVHTVDLISVIESHRLSVGYTCMLMTRKLMVRVSQLPSTTSRLGCLGVVKQLLAR